MNLRWGYNNVWIKEGDKLKVVFMTTEELFELMVMFLGLTNSPAIFQTMMNEILWDLINTSKVASFINNVIVGTEEEKRYNKMVEEVVKRLMENDLYMQVKGEGSRILRSSNQIWGDQDGRREGKRSIRLANCQARFTPGWKSAGCTRRWADLWNDLGFSLCAAPSVCRIVATSDEGEKSEWEWVLNGVSPLNTGDRVQ